MNNNVLAIVDGREITQTDLMHLMQSIGQGAAQFQGPEGQKQLVDELVMQELLYSDALAQGLQAEEEYTKALEEMQRSLLKQYAMKKLMDSVEDATDAEIQEYYDAHASQFTSPEQATANHILVDTEEEALRIAEEIKNGLAFKEAAEKYSNCPSKSQGGALGSFSRGQMVPEFENVTFQMEVGTVSEPVKTQFGYHLIELEALTPAGNQPLEAVKPQVKDQLLMAKRQAVYVGKRQELEGRYEVSINNPGSADA